MTKDDSFLSAFLDGQLDPEENRRAETAVASDPAAAEALHSLAAVSNLVAGLARPRGPDVAPLVLRRLAAARPRRWKSWSPYVGRGLGGSALAAGVALVVYLGTESRIQGTAEAPRRGSIASSSPARQTDARVAVAPVAGGRDEPGGVRPSRASERAPAPIVASPAVVAEHAAPRRDVPPGLVELWKTVGPRRDFVVSSGPEGSTAAAVATLLGQSTHREYYRILLPAGSGDVAHGEPAVAFAAALDPNEFATLRRRLESRFGRRVAFSEADPETASLLADVGLATPASPTPVADVSFPQNEFALRFRSDDAHEAGPDRVERPEDVGPPAPNPNPAAPSVVLIWILNPPSS